MIKLIRALRLLVTTSVKAAPGASIACLAETAGVIVSLLQPWCLAIFVAAAAAGDARRMAIAAVVFVGQIALSRVLVVVGMNARATQLERVGGVFAAQIAHITASIPTVDHLDDPRYLDQLHILREQQGAIGLAVNTLLNQLNSLVHVAGVLTLATAADPRMLLVAAAGVPALLTGPIVARWQGRAETAGAEPGRLARALLTLGINPQNAGEIRVFGLTEGLRERQRSATRAWRAPMLSLAVRESALTAFSQVLFFGIAALILAWLVRDTLTLGGSVGDVALAVLLVTRLQGVSGELRGVISEVAGMSRTAGRYLWLLDIAQELGADHAGTRPPPAGRLPLLLENVSYAYPTADHPALDQISLDLHPGMIIAVVGENGAGKSTLAELIAGIRRPTAGRITLGGEDLAALDLTQWREGTTGAFQDHVRFELPLSDAVGIGDLPHRTDDVAVEAALTAGAAADVALTAPSGLRTQLGASWPDGVDLSGGQWQRLAIARSMMRTAPRVRILDEPTAALDAITEHELFTRYTAAAREGRHTGTITILVTHRFSTVSAADVIIVLDQGRVIESGSHAELLSAGGHYAHLYGLQAKGYQAASYGDWSNTES